jgi:hypothetical protein
MKGAMPLSGFEAGFCWTHLMLTSTPTVCDPLIFQYLLLAELVATRGCSRALRVRLDPPGARRSWLAVKPKGPILTELMPAPYCKLLHAAYAFSIGELAGWHITLQNLCRFGRLTTAQWLVNTFSLTAADARAQDNAALRYICANGHLATAQWLVERFALTAADARAKNNQALRYACEGGHIAIAQWLVDRFELTAADVRANDNGALRGACYGNHLVMAQWLAFHFKLTATDARALNNQALVAARLCGRRQVSQWLIKRFGLTQADAHAM